MKLKSIISAVIIFSGIAKVFAASFSLVSVSPRVFAPREYEPQYAGARFTIANPNYSEVNSAIFDITGREVRSSLPRESEYVLVWDGRDSGGQFVRAGVYVYQLEADGVVINGTVIVAH